MGTNKKYWKGFDELEQTEAFVESAQNEFPQELSVEEFLSDDNVSEASTGRRDFLKFLGFSVAAATLAACEAPVIKAVPYAVKPEDVTPGVANWYASSYYDGAHFANILVKSREGRPIHIKGNRDFGFTKGAVNPQIAASVLSLYNGERLQAPTIDGQASTWGDFDSAVTKALNGAKNKKIVLLSGTEISPSTKDVIELFKAKYGGYTYERPVMTGIPSMEDQPADDAMPAEGAVDQPEGNVVHIQYDAISYNGIREANKESFGERIIPDYDFSKAKVIVSVSCDFLNSWVLPTQFAPQYGMTRNPDGEWMSKHFQFESNMSQTGANADYRGLIKPSQQGVALAYLHKAVTGSSVSGVDTSSLDADTIAILDLAAEELKGAKGESLVVSGSNRKSVQVIVNSINHHLGNYKSTINLNNPIEMHQSEDEKVAKLIKDMGAGNVGAIVMWNTNPAYTIGESFTTALGNVGASICISQYMDETASLCKFVAAENHALESWNDYAPKMWNYAMAQPTIRPLHDTRPAAESLMIWAGEATHVGKDSTNYHDHMKMLWKFYGYPMQRKYSSFSDYWNAVVHQGYDDQEMIMPASSRPFNGNIGNAGKDIGSLAGDGSFEIALYQKAAIGNGSQAGNPWLQEMPDTITKVTWDNYATMSYEDCEKLGCEMGLGQETPSTVVTITVGDKSFQLPVYPQPGQAPGTIGIAVGYGRGANGEKIGSAAYQTGTYGDFLEGPNGGRVMIGQNAYSFVNNGDFDIYGANVAKTEETYNLACTQTHSTVMARNSIVKETTLEIYKTKSKGAYNHQHTLHMGWDHEEKPVTEFNLWPDHPVEHVGHRWGMTIDLNSCIGCGSCLIACQSENNVPVVGKDEVRRGREMHWLRLDRYYASDIEPTVGTRDPEKFAEGGYSGLKKPANNPKVVMMPMLCHHCNHAPCETVCPVAATTHSNEGLNQMAYNRCIGTRYCGNNCPYKVRRFNWFNYPSYRKFTEVNPSQDDLGRMVLNPDVVVRTRGVMEKCSMCVQRIQSGKLEAKKDDRMVKDGDVTTACADVCPTNAITMGDWNDVGSEVRKSSEEDRAYQVLEEVGVKPNIWYKLKVRNEKNEALDEIQVEHAHAEHEGHEGEEEHGEVETGHENGHDDHGGH